MDWLKAGGIGFITLVTVPVAFIILAVTIIGLPVALLSLALWGAGLYLAKIVVAEFVGRSLLKNPKCDLVAGRTRPVVVFAVNLPWIGGLINFLLILLGLGAIAISIYKTRFQDRSRKPRTETVPRPVAHPPDGQPAYPGAPAWKAARTSFRPSPA